MIQSDLVHMALNAADKKIKADSHAPLFCNLISFLCCIGRATMHQLIMCIN